MNDLLKSEADLLKEVADNDSSAISALYDKYSSLIYSLLLRLTDDQEKSEKLLPEIFTNIWKQAPSFSFEQESFYTYIVLYIRKLVFLEEQDISSFKLEGISSLIPKIDYDIINDNKNNIISALESLTEAQQHFLYVSFYKRNSLENFAEEMKLPVQTLKSKIAISLAKLSEKIEFLDSESSLEVPLKRQIALKSFDLLSEEESQSLDIQLVENDEAQKLLGTYQIIISLFPSLLEMQTPKRLLKLTTARLIYEASGKELKNVLIDFGVDNDSVEEIKDEDFEQVNPSSRTEEVLNEASKLPDNKDTFLTLEDFEAGEETRLRNESSSPIEIPTSDTIDSFESEVTEKEIIDVQEDPEHFKLNTENDIREEEYLEEKKKRSYLPYIVLFVMFFLFTAGLLYIYYNFMTKEKELSSEVEMLKDELNNSKNASSANDEIVKWIYSAEDIKIVSLRPTEGSSAAQSKIISNQNGKNILVLNQLPGLNDNESYELISVKDGTESFIQKLKVSGATTNILFEYPVFLEEGIKFKVIQLKEITNKEGNKEIIRKEILVQ